MSIFDDSQDLDVIDSILPQAIAATLNGTTVDTDGFNASSVIFGLGVFAGSGGPSATLDIQDSADGASWASVAASFLVGGALPTITPGTSDNQTCKRGYVGPNRYLRAAVIAISGTGPSLPLFAAVVRSKAQKLPTTATE